MSSLMMHVTALVVRTAYQRRMRTAQRVRQWMDAPKRPAAPPSRLRRRHTVTSRRLGGFTTWSIVPKRPRAGKAVLYVHGGGYYLPIQSAHWNLISALADSGVRVEVPLYPLAPEYTAKDAYPFLTRVYEELVSETGDPSRITLMGDSAGGGLALGLAQVAAAGRMRPGRIILISPWLDLTLSDPAIAELGAKDPWLAQEGLIAAGHTWAGHWDPAEARLSPLNGPLADLPPTHLYIGDRDIFWADAHSLARAARGAGRDIDLVEMPGGVHVYPLTPTPEGCAARAAIIQQI
ncbi:alpha/beta hydrolase fold domain-containing protein [Streptomyces sp. NPDC058739]|uniref:alpha/beta hydrolase fold domain-containing protein n=1 Tax=Streptomyces sp. NPDC058739 TaxID=3346618 RepID=UPI003685DB45